MTGKSLFETPPYTDALDVKNLLLELGNKEDFQLLADSRPYIRMSTSSASLKSKDGPDLNSGDLGNPVEMNTDGGWKLHYYPKSKDKPASVEVGAPFMEEGAEQTVEVKTVNAAVELVELLDKQGWEKFTIEAGSPRFIWAVWAYLKHTGKTVTGHRASAEDKRLLAHATYVFNQLGKKGMSMENSKQPGLGATVSGSGDREKKKSGKKKDSDKK